MATMVVSLAWLAAQFILFKIYRFVVTRAE